MKNSFLLPHLQKLMSLPNWPNAAVPIMSQINEYIPWMAQVPFDYLYRDDPVGMAECTLLLQEYIGVDDLGSNLDMYNFEAESMGAEISFYADHIPDVNRSNFLIKTEEDLELVKFNGLESGRFPYMTRYIDAYKEYTGIEVLPSLCAPWSMACNLYGIENLIIATIENPEFVHKLMKKIVTEVQLPFLRALHEKYPMAVSVSMADAFASPPMTNEEIRDEFIAPYNDMLQDLMKQEGLPVTLAGYFFVSKAPEDEREHYLEMLTKAGQNVAMVFDPDVQILGPSRLREYADRKLCGLLLGISNNILIDKKPEEIAEQVKKYVLEGKRGITPLLFFFNNIAPGTPAENVHAAVAAAVVYGQPDADENTPLVLEEHISYRQFIQEKMNNNTEGYKFDWLKKSKLFED